MRESQIPRLQKLKPKLYWSPMPKITLITGFLMIILGAASYILTGRQSMTALIPACFGIPFMILGALGYKDALRKHVMHAAATLSLISMIATFKGTLNAFKLLGSSAAEVARPEAAISMSIMFTLCLIFLILCIRSFVVGRLLKKQAR